MGHTHMSSRMGHSVTRCSAPAHLRGTLVRVSLMDMGHRGMMGVSDRMMLRAIPAIVPAGRITFVATDLGSRRHELVVLPLRSWQNFGQRASNARGRVLERGALGEASRPCGPGIGTGLRPLTTGWVTLDLAPGRYELVCNEPHHYQRGMYAGLVVS
jgi:hypothetical protein